MKKSKSTSAFKFYNPVPKYFKNTKPFRDSKKPLRLGDGRMSADFSAPKNNLRPVVPNPMLHTWMEPPIYKQNVPMIKKEHLMKDMGGEKAGDGHKVRIITGLKSDYKKGYRPMGYYGYGDGRCKHGMHMHKCKMCMGMGDGRMNPQLRMGIKAESEHRKTIHFIKSYYQKHGTLPKDKLVFKKISQDHLKEDPKYYSKLKVLESKKKL